MNKGKRMVFENDIKKIGQGGGGGGSYTAGDGIDITNDVISVDDTIVNTDTAQTITGKKTFEPESGETYKFDWGLTLKETNSGKETKYFYNEISSKVNGSNVDFKVNNVTIPAGKRGNVALEIPTYGLTDDMLPEASLTYATYTIEELISFGLPLFAPKAVQDLGDTYPYAANIIPLVKNPYSGDVTEINLKGYFGVIINDATNNYPIIIGATHNYSTTNKGNAFATLRVYRSADNDYRIRNARYRRRQLIQWAGTNGIYMHTVIAAADGCDVKIDNSSTVTYNDQIVPYTTATTALIIKNPQPDVKYYQQVGTPTTAGTYKLTVTVDANGYPTFEWVAEQV